MPLSIHFAMQMTVGLPKSNSDGATQTDARFVRFLLFVWVGQADVRVRILKWVGLTAQRGGRPKCAAVEKNNKLHEINIIKHKVAGQTPAKVHLNLINIK